VTLRHGGWQIDLLDCGTIALPAEAVSPELDGPRPVPVTATLLRGHGRTLLVDAGCGPCAVLWPGGGGTALGSALAVAGCSPAEITDVLLTHLDFDHCGGAVAGTWPDDIAPAFPQASYMVAADDIDWWWEAEERPLNVGTPVLRTVRDGTMPLPQVRVRSAPGHSPGHSVLEISGEEGVLMHLADAIHDRLHVPHPDWDGYYDADAERALATRMALLGEAEARGATVIASHIEQPGRIVRRGGVLAWADLS
jgi:glyoxylase-like metal-dependent hydrolase (beta-lactamase superfamily II)